MGETGQVEWRKHDRYSGGDRTGTVVKRDGTGRMEETGQVEWERQNRKSEGDRTGTVGVKEQVKWERQDR